MLKSANAVYVVWASYIRRPESMQPYFGYKLAFIKPWSSQKLLKPFVYLSASIRTLLLLFRSSPDVLWIQLAPTVLLYLGHFYAKLRRRKLTLIADCHNSMFRDKWIRMPGAVAFLNQCDIVVVHNKNVKNQAVKAGVDTGRIHLLETRPASIDCAQYTGNLAGEYGQPWVLFPCSFDADEPVAELFGAAARLPDINFVVTGNTGRAGSHHSLENIPANVTMAGFLSLEEFNAHLCQADVVIGLTKRDDIQLSVANESIGACRAMVLSNSELIRSLFFQGAIYVDPFDSESIANGVSQALRQRDELREASAELKLLREERWLGQAGQLDGASQPSP